MLTQVKAIKPAEGALALVPQIATTAPWQASPN